MDQVPFAVHSLKDQVYGRIKAAIVHGRLRPGGRILEQELAARWGISRTPIREALLQLASEGMVVVAPRRGIFVAHRTLDEIEEIYWLLGLLEAAAAARAIRRMPRTEVARLRDLTRQLDDCRLRGDVPKFVEINNQSHEVFLAACGSPRLEEICARLRERLHQYPLRMLSLPGWMDRSLKEHREILRAFERRRERDIEGIVRRHWRFKETRREILEKLTQADEDVDVGLPAGDPADRVSPQPDRPGGEHGPDRHRGRGEAKQAVSQRHRSRAGLRTGKDPHR